VSKIHSYLANVQFFKQLRYLNKRWYALSRHNYVGHDTFRRKVSFNSLNRWFKRKKSVTIVIIQEIKIWQF